MEACPEVLDALCPLHAILDRRGRIAHAGPTLVKLRPEDTLPGRDAFEVFEVTRPRTVAGIDDLFAHARMRLHLRLRAAPRTKLKGVLVPLPGERGAILNLSFGISILDAVRDYALTNTDFAATDLAMEMLYLVEAKSAAMEASRKLNLRLQGAMIAAEEQAFTDTLTGLKNRRALDHVLARLVERGARFAVMQLDLDYFKAVNDSMGHAAGDHVLQQVARILVEETRAADTVARVGGDEFVIVLGEPGGRDQVAHVASRLIRRIEEPVFFDGRQARISASAGSALSWDYARPDPARMLADADRGLYASKAAGRARHSFAAPDG
jgi:diguanylate cyclase (GGDEF)-like protein